MQQFNNEIKNWGSGLGFGESPKENSKGSEDGEGRVREKSGDMTDPTFSSTEKLKGGYFVVTKKLPNSTIYFPIVSGRRTN